MRPWQFSRPKGPGFGISKSYFLSVLSSHSVMPTVAQLANPKGGEGAVPGFAVPLGSEEGKEALGRPMERGAYAVASKDRKTVLRLAVVSKEEAGFDPEAFAQSALALETTPELVARLRATWTLAQLTFESHDPDVYPALNFFLAVVRRLGELTEGVVGDSISQRYLLPDQILSPVRGVLDRKVYAEEHVAARFRARPDGIHAYTLGLQKFAMPEFEISNLMDGDEKDAGTALLWLSQQVLEGTSVKEGYQVGDPESPFEVREGGFDRAFWEDLPVFELLPPTTVTATEAVRAWAKRIDEGRLQ